MSWWLRMPKLDRAIFIVVMAFGILLLLALTGCAGIGAAGNFFKDLEQGAFDKAARAVSEYCEGAQTGGLFAQRTRIEARREIRQRGTNGPPTPTGIEGLDDQTAEGDGPVVIVWCKNETDGWSQPVAVPVDAWRMLIRDWRD